MRKTLPAIALLTLVGCGAQRPIHVSTSGEPRQRTIEVTGTAEIKAVPDEFVIQARVRTFAPELAAAAADNDARVARVVRFARKQGLERKYVVVDDVSVRPVHKGHLHLGTWSRLGFEVERKLTIIVHDPKRLEPVLKGSLAQGAERLINVSFGRRDIAALATRARLEATRKARSEAVAMASALGQRISRPLAITEAPASSSTGNFVYGDDTPELGDTMSVGKVRVAAAVKVRFALAN